MFAYSPQGLRVEVNSSHEQQVERAKGTQCRGGGKRPPARALCLVMMTVTGYYSHIHFVLCFLSLCLVFFLICVFCCSQFSKLQIHSLVTLFRYVLLNESAEQIRKSQWPLILTSQTYFDGSNEYFESFICKLNIELNTSLLDYFD